MQQQQHQQSQPATAVADAPADHGISSSASRIPPIPKQANSLNGPNGGLIAQESVAIVLADYVEPLMGRRKAA